MHPTVLRAEYAKLLGLTNEILTSYEEYTEEEKTLIARLTESEKAASAIWSKAWDDNLRYGVQSQRAAAREAINNYWQKAIDELKVVANA